MKYSTDFDDHPTRVDIQAPIKAKQEYELFRYTEKVKAHWDMEEFQRNLKQPTRCLTDFDEVPTVAIGRPAPSVWSKLRDVLFPFIRASFRD
jgi:hypothetical protein